MKISDAITRLRSICYQVDVVLCEDGTSLMLHLFDRAGGCDMVLVERSTSSARLELIIRTAQFNEAAAAIQLEAET
jgi:hypothetical protein